MGYWTASQAEAWMREHPGRWLEDSEGDMWRWLHGEWGCAYGGGLDTGMPSPSELELQTMRAECGQSLTFHPPREHWAAEAREKVWEIALRWRNAPLSLTLAEDRKLAGKCLDDICALFRAAPEGS